MGARPGVRAGEGLMWFYRALLHLYPSSFRAEYGEEMCAVFERRRTSPLAAAFEVLSNAPAVHWDILRQDLRYTARTLARAPGFTAVAILVLALGIGANTAVFSVTDYVLIRPLPFPSPDRLVSVWETLPGYQHMELSPGQLSRLEAHEQRPSKIWPPSRRRK